LRKIVYSNAKVLFLLALVFEEFHLDSTEVNKS